MVGFLLAWLALPFFWLDAQLERRAWFHRFCGHRVVWRCSCGAFRDP